MPRFFIDAPPQGDAIHITGPDAHHISHVLRMRMGDTLTICDAAGSDYQCILEQLSEGAVTAKILSCTPASSEPDIWTTLYMALPKGDKMDFIVQKCTELGVCEVAPYLAARCVTRPDARALTKRTERWRKIAAEAAKQCGRGRIPLVRDTVGFQEAVREAAKATTALLLYEAEREYPLRAALRAQPLKDLSFFIGPEGGFDEEEVTGAVAAGLVSVTLGKRILRCETAPIAALAAIQYESGNL